MSRAESRPEDRHTSSPGANGGAACADNVVDAGRPAGRVLAALAGLREPVVLILLAIAFFTAISGKPVDGVLMLIVAAGLAWDAGRRALRPPETGRHPQPRQRLRERTAVARPGRRARPRIRRPLAVAALLAGGAACAGLLGSFSRYSWPTTASIIGLGTVVVLIGWQGPRRRRPDGGRPLAGSIAWAVLLVAGCLWELAALLQQPSITTDSYAHPTISTLTDPLLASAPGRMLLLAAWLAAGWYLVDR